MNYRLTELKVLLFLLLLSAVSCQRPMYDEEDDEDGVSQTNLPLKISARSSGESQINYPAYIYAFAEDGSCSASLKMTDNAQIEMKLPPARYTIVAIAGLGEEYIVPKDPSLDDVIVMKENNRSSRALMMGTSTVTIANKKNISVSVTLYYAVSLVNISLEDIPANVKKVSLQISPLYSSCRLQGSIPAKTRVRKLFVSLSRVEFGVQSLFIFFRERLSDRFFHNLGR